jgi:hypothetical protein
MLFKKSVDQEEQVYSILLLDETRIEIKMSSNSSGKQLLDQVFEQQNLIRNEKHFFGLQFESKKGKKV